MHMWATAVPCADILEDKLSQHMRNQRLELVCADKPLRFEVGDEVEARTEDGWTKGKVLVQWDDADGGMVLGSPFFWAEPGYSMVHGIP